MLRFWQNHRLGQKPEFVFEDKGGPENVPAESGNLDLFDAKAAKSEFLKWAKENGKEPSELETAADQWVDENYGAEKLHAKLAEELKGIPEKLISEAVARSEADLKVIKVEFRNSLRNRNTKYEKTLEKGIVESKGRLEALRKTKGGVDKIAELSVELDQLIESAKNVDPQNTAELRSQAEKAMVEDLVPALNDKYLNLEWQKKTLKNEDYSEYEKLAKTLMGNNAQKVKGQLDYLFSRPKEPMELGVELAKIRAEILQDYVTHAGADEVIDLNDLKGLKEKSEKGVAFARELAETQNGDEMMARMEARFAISPKETIQAAEKMAELVCDRAERDGAEKSFIDALNKELELKPENAVTNFDDARTLFEKEVKARTEGGFRKGYELVEKMTQAVYGGQIEAEGLEAQRPAFKGMVDVERVNFLTGVVKPANVDDIHLLEFMQLDSRMKREAFLADPAKSDALFVSIKNIEKRHGSKEKKEWMDKIPKKNEKLTTGYDVGHPTDHDLVARHMAIVGLAKEAKFVIENIATTEDFGGSDLADRFNGAKASDNPAPTDYQFRDPNRKVRSRYVSEGERVGLNRRSIGFAILQTWGAITFLFNLKNAMGDRSWKAIKAMPGKLLTNPFAYLGAGAVFGPHSLKRDPESLGYLTQSEGGKKRIEEHWKLHNIKEKVGYTSLMNYINNGEEAAAMRSLVEKDPKRKGLEKALEKASKRNWWNPVLLKEDLVGIMDEGTRSKLPTSVDGSQEKIRYLFYKKFLTDPKVNLDQLRSNCQGWQG